MIREVGPDLLTILPAANFTIFRQKGLSLTSYYGVTHPSQPNYMAAIAGDYFGMQNDAFYRADRNISTVVDLLSTKSISWAHYQEDLPYSGFEGMGWVNHKTGQNDYVRKHNPAIMHDSVASSEQRLSQIKNLSLTDTSRSMFHRDLKANKLPQWMFITPNMTSDGHDTSVTTAGKWCQQFLTPLLNNTNFMNNTLVLLTWDENETYALKNNVLGVLLGDALPKELIGQTDDNFYNHYSEIATVSANWDLPTLGRWDVGANVFSVVANKTGDTLRTVDVSDRYYNYSYAGFFNQAGGNQRYPAPNLNLDNAHGRPVLQRVKDIWQGSDAPTYYEDTAKIPDGLSPPVGYAPVN